MLFRECIEDVMVESRAIVTNRSIGLKHAYKVHLANPSAKKMKVERTN